MNGVRLKVKQSDHQIFLYLLFLTFVSLFSISQTSIAPTDFVDSMEEKNYVATSLTKPMGIVFEENDKEVGGIFVLSLSEEGAAKLDSTVKSGDQLVAVNTHKVSGLSFDDALGKIVDATTEKTTLNFFRSTEKQLYGPTGASTEWLEEYIASSTSAHPCPSWLC